MSEIKKITWGTFYASKRGFGLQNILNEGNFQPGQFIVVDDNEYPDMYKILAVKSEEEQPND